MFAATAALYVIAALNRDLPQQLNGLRWRAVPAFHHVERGNKQSQEVVGPSTVTVLLKLDAAEAVKSRLEEVI